MLKDFISKQTAFNKSVEEKLDKIDVLASKFDSLALDVELLKLKVFPHDVKESKTLNAIQVKIDDNIRMLAELHARWEREDEMARNMKVCTITTTSDVVSNASNPLTVIGVEKIPTPCA
jgi:L-alanine-DL-glutamate epimerase-like enolase superfamily enzyme